MMSLAQIVARTKLPVSVRVFTGYSVDYVRVEEPIWLIDADRSVYAFDAPSARAAYLEAVAAYLPEVSERGLLLNEVA